MFVVYNNFAEVWIFEISVTKYFLQNNVKLEISVSVASKFCSLECKLILQLFNCAILPSLASWLKYQNHKTIELAITSLTMEIF